MWKYAVRSKENIRLVRYFSTPQGPAKTIASSASSGSKIPSIAQVCSRRVWEKERPKLKVDTSSASKFEEKPWPKSVIYGAAGAAALVIPYSIAWILVSVPVLRTRFLTPNQVDFLRRYFGTEEPCYVPYTDVLNKDGVTDPMKIPYVLPGERSPHQEATQAQIEKMLTGTIPVTITVTDTHEQSTSSLILPASELANEESLRKHYEGLLTTNSNNNDNNVGFVAVDFPESDADANSSSSQGEGELDTEEIIMIDQSKPVVDPLLEVIPIYSTWYYQQPLQNLNSSANHVTSQYTNDELVMRQLESDIARLEVELRDLRSTRAFDDIQEELNMCRSQLRRLKWKRWLPW